MFPMSRKGNNVKQIRLGGKVDKYGLICHEKGNKKGTVHTTIIEIVLIKTMATLVEEYSWEGFL